MRGKRTVRGGRQQARTALYIAALTATRFNPPIRAFHQCLVKAGKPEKLALTAAMRELVVVLDAILRTGAPRRARETAARPSGKTVAGTVNPGTVNRRRLPRCVTCCGAPAATARAKRAMASG
jgi:Transposase IS116/IS110/IS902 family